MFQPSARLIRLLVQCLSLAVVLALSIAIPNLSPRCGFAGEKPSRDADAPNETRAELPPFDLTYLPPNAMGVIALRPNAILRDPAMKPLAGMANEGLARLRQLLKLSAEPRFSIQDIEEIAGHFTIVPGDEKHAHQHSLVAGLAMIRATHDLDWLKLMRQLDPKTEEVRHEDRVYYRSHFSALFGVCITGTSPNAAFCYYMPDKRTLAFLPEKILTAFVNGQSVQRPHFSWDKDWKYVEHGLIAVAMDNRWANGLSMEQIGGEPPWTSLSQNAVTMAAGFDWKDGIDLQACLRGKNTDACYQIEQDLKDILTQWERGMETEFKKIPEDAQQSLCFHLQAYRDLLNHAVVEHVMERPGRTVRVQMMAKISFADFAKDFFVKRAFGDLRLKPAGETGTGH